MNRIDAFATPLFRFDCDAADEIIEALAHIEMRPSSLGTNYAANSVDTYLHKSIPALGAFIRECCDAVWSEIGAPDTELLVTQSWATLCFPGQGIHAHRHANAYASGILYLSDHQNGTVLFVDDLWRYWSVDPHAGDPIASHEEPTRKGSAIMFPASVSHTVHPNRDAYNRPSIAWNAFPAGIFKDAKSLAQLEIIQ